MLADLAVGLEVIAEKLLELLCRDAIVPSEDGIIPGKPLDMKVVVTALSLNDIVIDSGVGSIITVESVAVEL